MNKEQENIGKDQLNWGKKSLKFKTQWVTRHMRIEEKISKYEERAK